MNSRTRGFSAEHYPNKTIDVIDFACQWWLMCTRYHKEMEAVREKKRNTGKYPVKCQIDCWAAAISPPFEPWHSTEANSAAEVEKERKEVTLRSCIHVHRYFCKWRVFFFFFISFGLLYKCKQHLRSLKIDLLETKILRLNFVVRVYVWMTETDFMYVASLANMNMEYA